MRLEMQLSRCSELRTNGAGYGAIGEGDGIGFFTLWGVAAAQPPPRRVCTGEEDDRIRAPHSPVPTPPPGPWKIKDRGCGSRREPPVDPTQCRTDPPLTSSDAPVM